MRSFLVFLAIVAVIGLAWAIKPLVDNRARDHEQRLVASLNLVEEAVVSSSTDILRVDLFSPEIVRLSDDGRWRISGILETQNRAGKAVSVRYVAAVAFTCMPYSKAGCGKVETLSIDEKSLVIDGAIVAELQSVLGTNDALSETLPGAGVTGTASLPALQLGTPTPEPPAPTPEAPASEAPAASAAPEPTVATTAPTSDSEPINEPIQGDRQIFLIQKNLRQLGYDPGPVDGRGGPRTTSAIQAYQQQANLTVDGKPSAALLEHITHAP